MTFEFAIIVSYAKIIVGNIQKQTHANFFSYFLV